MTYAEAQAAATKIARDHYEKIYIAECPSVAKICNLHFLQFRA